MKHRIVIDLSFSDPDALIDILDKVLDHIDESEYINYGTDHQESGIVTIHQCRHDTDPHYDCIIDEEYHPPPPT